MRNNETEPAKIIDIRSEVAFFLCENVPRLIRLTLSGACALRTLLAPGSQSQPILQDGRRERARLYAGGYFE
jgi:hypothetical protein